MRGIRCAVRTERAAEGEEPDADRDRGGDAASDEVRVRRLRHRRPVRNKVRCMYACRSTERPKKLDSTVSRSAPQPSLLSLLDRHERTSVLLLGGERLPVAAHQLLDGVARGTAIRVRERRPPRLQLRQVNSAGRGWLGGSGRRSGSCSRGSTAPAGGTQHRDAAKAQHRRFETETRRGGGLEKWHSGCTLFFFRSKKGVLQCYRLGNAALHLSQGCCHSNPWLFTASRSRSRIPGFPRRQPDLGDFRSRDCQAGIGMRRDPRETGRDPGSRGIPSPRNQKSTRAYKRAWQRQRRAHFQNKPRSRQRALALQALPPLSSFNFNKPFNAVVDLPPSLQRPSSPSFALLQQQEWRPRAACSRPGSSPRRRRST